MATAYFVERIEETVRDGIKCTRKSAETIDYTVEEGQELTKETARYLLDEINRLYHVGEERNTKQDTAYSLLDTWFMEISHLYNFKENLLGRLLDYVSNPDDDPQLSVLGIGSSLTSVCSEISNGRDSLKDLERSMLRNEKGLADLCRMETARREEEGLPEY